ncbi:MAG TPA: DUF2182 domain-containing protein [Mycobacteriales bacterium]|nr:DUF2182 domain-containing protein [Mycobacteriales bacterium]
MSRSLMVLLVGAGALWWWSNRLAAAAPMTPPLYLLMWLVMMAAMMLPALEPVIRLYARMSERSAAPLPVFLSGYFAAWMLVALPAYGAWRLLADPLMNGEAWAGRLAGAVLLATAAYQVSPAKQACLRACRSPLTLFMSAKGSLADPRLAVRLGVRHGLWCLGCCWALMAALTAVGVMQPLWMIGLATVIYFEKTSRHGDRLAPLLALPFAGLGLTLLIHPAVLTAITQ